MSKRCELQKEYFKDFGNYKGNGKYSDDYVKWLEDKTLNQGQSLPIDNVSDKRELLISFMEFRDQVYWGENEFTENEEIIDLWLKRN